MTTTPTYRIEFGRVGRNHNVPPLEVTAADVDEVAEAVWRVANRHLGSRFFDVSVDLETGEGWIEGGRFGRFTVTEIVPCSRCETTTARPGVCCSSHGKRLCHLCYRRTHFVEVCVAGCKDCAAENLPGRLSEVAR